MDSHDRLLSAFLAGDLAPDEALRWDEHLLACELCWRAVREDRAGRQAARLLRQPAPPGLADRVAFAVEVAAGARAASRRTTHAPGHAKRLGHRGRGSRWRLAAAAALAVAAAVTLILALPSGGHQAGSVPAAVAAVARYARAIQPPGARQRSYSGWPAAPVRVGRPVTMRAGGQRIVVRTWRVGRTEAVVAVSGRPFPMPGSGHGIPGRGMAWSARLGPLSLYCVNGRTSELVAAPVPVAELAALAARLPLA